MPTFALNVTVTSQRVNYDKWTKPTNLKLHFLNVKSVATGGEKDDVELHC